MASASTLPPTITELCNEVAVRRSKMQNARRQVAKSVEVIAKNLLARGWPVRHLQGSAHEGLKVSEANEFDFMFEKNVAPQQPHSFYQGGRFVQLPTFNRETELRSFQSAVDTAIASAKQVYKARKNGLAIMLDFPEDRAANSERVTVDLAPSIRLAYGAASWPDKWTPVARIKEHFPHLKNEDFEVFAVAKGPDGSDSSWWRVSFSNLERKISLHLDQEDTSRKMCLRVAKHLLLDQGTKLVSYQLKCAWLHFVSQKSTSPAFFWEAKNLKNQAIGFLEYVLGVVKKGALPHYIIVEFNLLDELSEASRRDICSLITARLKYLNGL